MAQQTSATSLLMIGGIIVGGYFFVTGCVGNNADGTKKDCYGLFKPGGNTGGACTQNSDCGAGCTCLNQQCNCPDLCAGKSCPSGQTCDPGTGNCIGSGQQCSGGYVKNSQGQCVCNANVKNCNSSSSCVFKTSTQCSCKSLSSLTSQCPSGKHPCRASDGGCSCCSNPTDPCANKTCPTGFTKVKQGTACNCLCQKTCGGCTQKVATSTRCDCVQIQGSSGNCGWDGNRYSWCATGCDGKRHCNTITGSCANSTANRNAGCTAAKNSFCNTWSVQPSRCKSGSGNPCCAAQGTGGASGYTCGTDGNCNWDARVNFGGLKVWSGMCKGSFSGCCSYAIQQLKNKYHLSGYEVPAYTQPVQSPMLTMREIQVNLA